MRLDTVLKPYKTHPDYKEIIKYARTIYNKGERSEKQILNFVRVEFGDPPKIHLAEDYKGRKLFPFGAHLIEPLALHEMHEVLTLPPALYGALMPDAHPQGKPAMMPVGGVLLTENAVVPSAVGVDISCMVQLVITDFPVERLEENLSDIADVVQYTTRFGKGASFEPGNFKEHAVLDDPLWQNRGLGAGRYLDLAREQLGTSGSGNHFVDLVRVSNLSVDLNDYVTRDKEYVGILSHSGSRGPGFKTAMEYMKIAAQYLASTSKGYHAKMGYLPLDTEAGSAYWLEMTLMGKYADANHEVIADNILNALGAEALFAARSRHNFAFYDQTTGNVITRKGATPAAAGQIGLLPGSSGTKSYITRGLGNINALRSSAHGAGRPYSRKNAKEMHDDSVFNEFMAHFNIEYRGVAADETPFAYKDIEKIVDAQEDILTNVIGEMFPRVVVMGA